MPAALRGSLRSCSLQVATLKVGGAFWLCCERDATTQLHFYASLYSSSTYSFKHPVNFRCTGHSALRKAPGNRRCRRCWAASTAAGWSAG